MRQQWGWACVCLLCVLRLLVAAIMPTTPDEAYYWVWSRAMAAGYPDHPPMVALWIRLGTTIAGDNNLGLRLLGPVAVLIGSLFIAAAARDLSFGPASVTRDNGLRAALLLNATLAVGVGGVLMTPDCPLLFFCCALFWALGRLLETGKQFWWLPAGLFAGLAFDSKYTAVLPLAGLGAWLLSSRAGRAQLRGGWVWAGACVCVLVCLPVIAWNHDHQWVSFLRQGGRVGNWQPSRALTFLVELIGGQVALATPVIFFLFLCGARRCLQKSRVSPRAAMVAAMTLLPFAVFIQHAMGDRVQANWPVLIYPGLAIMAASMTSRLFAPAIGLGFAVCAFVYAQAIFSPLPLSPHHDVVLRQTGGWDGLVRDMDARAPAGMAVMADEYGLASELARRRAGAVYAGPDPRWRWFALGHVVPTEAILLRSERRHDDLPQGIFTNIEPLGEISRADHGRLIERYRLYHVQLAQIPAENLMIAQLPHPR